MVTATKKTGLITLSFATLLLSALLMVMVVACDKKCQQPPSEAFKTFNEVQWRLVETNDPGPLFKNLSLTSFIIMTFKRDYSLEVLQVLNNRQKDTPVLIGKYNVDKNAGLIRVQYEDPAGGGGGSTGDTGGTGSTGGSDAGGANVVQYAYDLGRDFQLTDTASGYNYRFVPFTGIVDTDSDCTF